MATTIISTPNLLSPMQDLYGNYFLLGNPSYSLTNFKYLTKLYAYDPANAGTTFSYLVQENVPPRPTTGYGLYSPYNSLLTLLSYQLDPFIGSPTLPTGNTVLYYINYGIEYNPGLTISTVLDTIVGATGYFGFSFSSPTSVQVGDLITITTQNGFFGGTATVAGVLTPNSFYTNLPFTASGTYSTGTITDLQRWEGTSSAYYGYNGTRQYGNQNINYYNTLVMGTSSIQPFLTDWPVSKKKYILASQYETLSFFINRTYFNSIGVNFIITYAYYDSTGATISTYQVAQSPNTYLIEKWDIPVFTPFHTVPSNTNNFSIYVGYDTTGTPAASETRYYHIDTDCSIYNNVRIMWMNSYGSWDYFNFRLDDMKTYDITRNEYKQVLPYNYTTGARQRTIQSQMVAEQHVVNTNFISETTYGFLSQLLLSPEVYVLDETNLVPLPIIITDSSFEFKTANRDVIFNLTLTYQMSFDIQTQKQ